MNTANPSSGTRKPSKVPRLLVIGAVTIIAAAVIVPLLTAGSPSSGGNTDDTKVTMPAACTPSYYALDPETQTVSNSAKEVPYAMGTPVFAKDYEFKPENAEADVAFALAELKERRECGANNQFDTWLTSSMTAEWSFHGRTERPVAFADIDAHAVAMNADRDLYAETVEELNEMESKCTPSIEAVPAKIWSIYVKPDRVGGLISAIGTSANAGHALVFTCEDGTVVKYRMDCGFQILHQTPPPGFPQCEYDNCEPCPPGETGTVPGVCKDSWTNAPNASTTAPIGGGDGGPAGAITDPVIVTDYVETPVTTAAPPVVIPLTPTTPTPTVDTGTQTNNGTVPTDGGINCNPVVISC